MLEVFVLICAWNLHAYLQVEPPASKSVHLGEVAFELYSHATDPLRVLESVHTVVGVPLTVKLGRSREACKRTQLQYEVSILVCIY